MSDVIAQLLQNNISQDHVFKYASKYGLNDDSLSSISPRSYNHFLCIRFNLFNLGLRSSTGLTNDDHYQAWIKYRCEIFKLITLPTILAQICDHFTVLLFFDTYICSEVHNLLGMIEPSTNIIPVFLDQRIKSGPHRFEEELRKQILKYSTPSEYILTTRLDSDDAINIGFIHNLQHYVNWFSSERLQRGGVAINFPFGLQVFNGKVRVQHYNRNPFLSIVEPFSKFTSQDRMIRKGPFQRSHNGIDRNFEVFNITTSYPMWLQYVHGGNASNTGNPLLPELVVSETLDRMFAGSLGFSLSRSEE